MAIHQLAIGMNYPGTSAELYGCVNDARDCAREWEQWVSSSTVVVNHKADREGFMRAGAKVRDRLEPGDLWLISTSGHGTKERTGGGYVEAIVTADFELIYDYEMAGLLASRPRGTYVAVFADHCYSGGLPRGLSNPGLPKRIPISMCHKHAHLPKAERLRALPNVIYFSASRASEVAYDGRFAGRAEGAMTHYLRRAWRERKKGITFRQLFNALTGYLPDDEYNQTPTYTASDRNMRRRIESFARAA